MVEIYVESGRISGTRVPSALSGRPPDGAYVLRAELAECPQAMQDALRDYAEKRRPRGGFLTAVLEGNLFEAALRADDTNRPRLAAIALWIDQNLPHAIHGTPEKVALWLEAGPTRD